MYVRGLIRLIRLILILAAVALAAFPLLVLLDLASGSDGYGLCPGGVRTCRNPYSAAPELSSVLTAALLVILGGFRITNHLSRRFQRSQVPPHG